MKRYKSRHGQKLIRDSYDRLVSSFGVAVEQKDVPTSFGSTHVIIAGSPSSPALLLLHGTGDNSAMMWIYNIRTLAEKFHVIAVDAIGGSGKSEPNANYSQQFEQAAWLDEVLHELKLEKVNVAGVSYGAYLAYYYGIMRPEKVNRIVCMAGCITGSSSELMLRMIRAFLPEALFPTRGNTVRLLKKLSGPNAAVFLDHAELMDHWHSLLKYFNNRSMMKHKIKILQDEQFDIIRDRCLFLIGDSDMLSNYPAAIERLKRLRMSYKIIAQAGHAINHEQAEQINGEIISFCRPEGTASDNTLI